MSQKKNIYDNLKLTSEAVNELFRDCLFSEDEIVNGKPTSPITTIKTTDVNAQRKFSVGFCTDRLNKNKAKIITLIDLLPELEGCVDLESLNYDKEGNKWCSDTKTLDQLIMMGMACNVISMTTIENENVTFISRDKTNDDLEVTGISPDNLPELDYLPAEQNRIDEKRLEEIGKNKVLEKFEAHFNKVKQIMQMLGFKTELKDGELLVYDIAGNLIGNMGNFFPTLGGGGTAEIETPRGKLEYSYSQDGQDMYRNIVVLSDYAEKKDSTGKKQFEGRIIRVELGGNNMNDDRNIQVKLTTPNAQDKIITFSVNENSLVASIENNFGPYGDYENGTARSVRIGGSQPFMNYESNQKGDTSYLEVNSGAIPNLTARCWKRGRLIPNDVYEFNDSYSFSILQQVIASPRTKNLVNYTLDKINSVMPGISSYISSHYRLLPVIQATMNSNNTLSPEIQAFWDKCCVQEADLPSEKAKQISQEEPIH